MEILNASAWVAIFHRYNGDNPAAWINVILLALFASVLIAAVFIDLDHFIVPEALNRVGVVIGLARDVVVLGIAYLVFRTGTPDGWPLNWNAARLWQETVDTHTYLGWFPRGFVGAALYAGLLWLVSFAGHVFYTREEGESFASVTRRFFVDEDATPDNATTTAVPISVGGETRATISGDTVSAHAGALPQAVLHAPEVPQTDADEEVDDSPPVRLRFSPGFIVLLSAGFLTYVVGPWSILAFLMPLFAFVALTRTSSESLGDALRRFFRSDDLPYEYDAPAQSLAMPEQNAPVSRNVGPEPVITGSNVGAMVWNRESGIGNAVPVGSTAIALEPAAANAVVSAAASTPLSFAESQADADQFAKEAESGAHGGMGLGDVKLAVAIGAILGPGQAVLSLIFAAFFGAVTGLVLKSIHRKNTLRLAVPFVPFMAAGAFMCLLFGEQILTWYMGFYGPGPATPAPSVIRQYRGIDPSLRTLPRRDTPGDRRQTGDRRPTIKENQP